MEDQAMEWENRGCEENSGRMRWIFDKGLALGKKMLVTGFVISSAPVILPPLVVISALGFACSVPFGVFLASYVCTEKIMSKLLPIPITPLYVEDGLTKNEGEDTGCQGNIEMENEEKEQRRRVEMMFEPDERRNEYEVDALKGDLYAQKGFEEDEDVDVDIDREKESSKMEEMKEEEKEEPPIQKNKNATEEICGVMIVIEGKERSGSNTGEEEVSFEVTNVAVELCQGGDGENNEELVRETRGLVERIRNEGESDKGLYKYKHNAEDVEVEAQLQHSSVGYVTSEGSEQPSYTLEESSDTLELNIPSRESEFEHGGISDQAPFSEEIIWRQIDAMRKIVGYTAARRGTYKEELKALYVFTGVEPPASMEDPSDVAEASDKVRFLMSIIGVK